MGNILHLVDVFARQRYAGNQLAVVEDAESLDDREMQDLAAEIGFSETTFVADKSKHGWGVRIFTPEAEIPFAGHPSLGTAHIIRKHIAGGHPSTIVLDLEVGEIPVEVRESDGHETLWMTQRPPEFGPELEHEPLAEVLSLKIEAIDTAWPAQVISTGLPTIVVPLQSRAALEDVQINRNAYETVTADREAKNILAFCEDPRDDENDLAVRVFAPFYGVPEDPATGSSNGCLASYLVRHEYLGAGEIRLRVEQGYEMGRPSIVQLEAHETVDRIHVEVGGTVVPVARGKLVLSEDG